ncbi:MAG: proton-conducting transporter membrane subunit [Acidobacteria bacterium]|nr:proton-conducting transporter membrane subunit [Acidobacteriota bacterium]
MAETLLWVLPLVPTVTALLMLTTRDRRILSALDVGGSGVLFALTLVLANQVATGGPRAFGVLRIDDLGLVFLLLVVFLTLAVSIYTVGWLKQAVAVGNMKPELLRSYFALVHAFVATMVVTVLADNLGVLWIAMEGTTITSAVLIGYHGHHHGLEAAWKYIIVTTIGISFGLFGTVLVFAAAAAAHVGAGASAMNWSAIMKVAPTLDPGIVRIGFIFVMVGYGTKAGLAPMHLWLPDAHSQALTPVSALLSGALIKCALLGIIRFQTIAAAACGPSFPEGVLLIFGLASIVVATPFILAQHDIKRLLGYHSVEHVGIVALGLGFGGPVGTYGALLHVVNHGVTKALAFFAAGKAIARYGTRDMRAIRGLLAVAPVGATLLMLAALSLAGVPPFSIFVSELMVLRAGIGHGHLVAVAIFLAMVVVIFAGLLHHVGAMVFGQPSAAASREPEAWSPLLGMMLLAAMMILLGLTIPGSLDGLLHRATEIIVD